MYGSPSVERIFQDQPVYAKPSMYRPSGWTETVAGYINEAKQLALCLIRNHKQTGRPHVWHVIVSIGVELTAKAHADLWTKACRKLRDRGVVCLWVREPTKNNRIHYHIVLRNPTDKGQLRRAFEESMPPRSVVKWRLRVEPVKREFRLMYYIVKAKVRGKVKGKVVEDKHRTKRLLFQPKLGLKKFGTVGPFWAKGKTKAMLWEEIRAVEQKIGEGLETPHLHELLDHVEDLTGGHIPRTKLERSFGYTADGPVVRDWIKEFLATGGDYWAEYRR